MWIRNGLSLVTEKAWKGGLLLIAIMGMTLSAGAAESVRVWEKVEISLETERSYANPYTDVEVWVDLKGPRFNKRCYGFFDGGGTFRVRVLASAAGKWSWQSGSRPSDPGLAGKSGQFDAVAWSEAEKRQNPIRRGMIRATTNGHAFEYADGTPFFLLGDTWWAIPTSRYPWYDDDQPRSIGPKAGLKDYVQFRKRQGYNCFAMIAAFPNWADGTDRSGGDWALSLRSNGS